MMKVINSTAGMTKTETYVLASNTLTKKFVDAGELHIAKYAIVEEGDKMVLFAEDVNGDIYASSSKTLLDSFQAILMIGDEIPEDFHVRIMKAPSQKNKLREFIYAVPGWL